MRMTINRLQNRNGKLRYRRKVPAHLRPYFNGKSEIVQALGLSVDQKARALLEVEKLDRRYDPEFLKAEKLHRAGEDPHAMAERMEQWALHNKYIGSDPRGRYDDGTGPDEHGMYDSPAMDSDYDRWLDSELEPYRQKLQRDPELHELHDELRVRIETVKRGSKVPAALTLGRAIDERLKHYWSGTEEKAEVATWPRFEEWIAAHPTLSKKTKGDPRLLPLNEINRALAREFVDYLHAVRGNGAETIRRRVGPLKALWNWASDHFEDETLRNKNPWARQGPPRAAVDAEKVASQKRLPFTRGHLELLNAYFMRNDTDRYMRAFLRLLMYTGARPLEIGGLLRSDVVLDVPTPYLRIKANVIRGLKTKGSERRVPIVGAALSEVKALVDGAPMPSTPLFPENFHDTTKLSNRANKALRTAGIPKERRLVVYSFRHTVNQAMLVSDARQHLRYSLLGHTEGAVNAVYGAGGVDMGELKAAMEEAFERLGEAPDYLYTPEEWV